MARRPVNRLFQTNEFRVYAPEQDVDTTQKHIAFFVKKHPNRQMGKRVTFIREKSALIRAAAAEARLELSNMDDLFGCREMSESNEDWERSCNDNTLESHSKSNCYSSKKTWEEDCDNSERTLNRNETNQHKDLTNTADSDNINLFHILPRETLLHVLTYLDVSELSKFIKTCRYSKSVGYDNFLWKQICYNTWQDPTFILVDLNQCRGTLRLWYNWNAQRGLTTLQVLQIFQKNLWRIAYIALHTLDAVPSIVEAPRTTFTRRTVECYATLRKVKYSSSVGNFRLVGVKNVSRVEFIVFNYTKQPWHRNEYTYTRPLPIFDLRNYGLRVTRSIRGQNIVGFFHRRGYYLKTDANRKVHLAYRYFPAIRYRLYAQKNRIFLLCQDLFLNAGESVDCYTMYEIIKERETNNEEETVDEEAKEDDTSPLINEASRRNSGPINKDATSQNTSNSS